MISTIIFKTAGVDVKVMKEEQLEVVRFADLNQCQSTDFDKMGNQHVI